MQLHLQKERRVRLFLATGGAPFARQDMMTNHSPLPVAEVDFYNPMKGGDQPQVYFVQVVNVRLNIHVLILFS